MRQKICLSIFMGSSLLATSFVSHASGVIQTGFFVGLAPSIAAMDYGYTDETSVSIHKGDNPILVRPDLQVGYGALMSSNNIYVGFDVGTQIKSSKTTELAYYNNTSVTNNASQGMTYYADFMPGLVFNDQSSVFYLVAGASDSSFTFEQENNGANNFSMTDNHFGYRFGAGYLYAFSDSFSVNAKIVYSNFGSIEYQYGTDGKYELNPEDGEFTLGINYTFGASEPGTASPFLGD